MNNKGHFLEQQDCEAGGKHEVRPDGGCVVCVKCGLSPC
jgi:hypothetical protein